MGRTEASGGQTGIRMREALAAGDPLGAAALVPLLDEAHRIELLLGAALRDARDEFTASHAWLAAETGRGEWVDVCRRLATGLPDTRLDDLAAGYVAERRVPEGWRAGGRAVATDVRAARYPDLVVAREYAGGASGLALLDAFADLPLYPAVNWYYRRGTIHAMGPRPLLILAASGGGE